MNAQELEASLADRTAADLRGIPGVRVAILYGSAATGKMRVDSDVDVAVLFDHPLDSEQKEVLMGRLEKALSRTVDLVDLFSLNGTILKQVLCGGRVLIGQRGAELEGLIRRMTYNQADLMPYVRRTLEERQGRFLHG